MIRSIGVAAFALAIAAPVSAGSITHRLQSSVSFLLTPLQLKPVGLAAITAFKETTSSSTLLADWAVSAQGTQLDIPLRTTQLLTPAKASA